LPAAVSRRACSYTQSFIRAPSASTAAIAALCASLPSEPPASMIGVAVRRASSLHARTSAGIGSIAIPPW
jgi:hypothetical protein